ncbi:MAG: hypothetical protein N2748_02540, partial [candidate division WOR-3 bacterium]|nr:hypothetical protein [candidate division WOR-3 bacterium]
DDGIYVINKFKNRLERTLTSVDGLSIPIKLAGYDPETGALWILTVSQLGPFRNQLIQFFPNTNIKHYIEIPFRTNSIAIADRYVYFDSANVKIFRLDKKTLSYAVSKKIPKGIYWYGEKSLNNLRDYTFLAPYFYYDDYLNRYEITCLYQDPPKLYVGTKGFGVLIYDLNSTRLVNHYQFGLKNISKKIWVTKEGIWFLTTGYPPVLILYQPTLDKWQYYDSRIGYLASYQSELIGFHLLDLIRREELNNIVEDDNGFWLSTDQSLYFYQKSASDIERIVLPDGRRLTDINTLYVNKNELLIGTDNGLLSYDKKTKKFFQLKDPGQDLDWGVFDIVQGDDRLYIATCLLYTS